MSEHTVIENAITKLDGETQKNVLDFIDFLRENEFQIEYNPNEYEEDKWSGAIGGVVGNSIGYMVVNGVPRPWTVWINSYDFGDVSTIDDAIKEAIWACLSKCGKCNPEWEKCRGGSKTILGKEFDDLCHSPLMIINPDTEKLKNIEKMLLILKAKEKL